MNKTFCDVCGLEMKNEYNFSNRLLISNNNKQSIFHMCNKCKKKTINNILKLFPYK